MSLSAAEADRRMTAPGQPFEVAVVDVRGVPTKVWKNAPPTLVDLLLASRSYGEETFLVYEDERVSFDEHYRAVARLATVLGDLGVGKGDRVALAMRNFPEWPVVFFAALAVGAVVVPLNAWWTPAELRHGLADSGSKVLVCDTEREQRVAAVEAQLPDLAAVVVAREDQPPAAGHLSLSELLGGAAEASSLPTVPLGPDDDAAIFYTSGTTGLPKGALGTHRNMCTNVMSLAYVSVRNATRAGHSPGRAGGRNAVLLTVPLFHGIGSQSTLMTTLFAGGKLVMVRRFEPGLALELIERERITMFGGVPTVVMQVLDHPDLHRRDTSSVKSVSYGGAPAPPDLVRRIRARFPASTASNGYGLTETTSVTALNQGDDYVAKPASVGPPVPVVDVKVVDPGGAEVPVGDVGELWVKGPNVIKGYWHRPEATAAAITDGWLHTGDLARVDDEGFVYIVDRAKDMLIRGGENVYCVEIESVLCDHPAVADAAVIGVPHETLGEEVGAVVQIRAGMTVDPEELQGWVGEHLAAFKVPVRFWWSETPLPRNPAGKILKRQLRDDLIRVV